MDKHLKRFVGLSVTIFTIAFVIHAGRLLMGLELSIGTYVVPEILSIFASIAAILMIFMGLMYLKRG